VRVTADVDDEFVFFIGVLGLVGRGADIVGEGAVERVLFLLGHFELSD